MLMATEALKLMAQIVISHASMSELTPRELVDEIKDVYTLLNSLELREVAEETMPGAAETGQKPEAAQPAIAIDEVVKEKYVVCLECGKKMRTLKTHLRKAHKLTPPEYLQRYALDPKNFPLVCKEYSEQRRKLAIKNGLGERRYRQAAAS